MTYLNAKLISIAATAAVLFTSPILNTSAEAHKRGSVCRYQAVDSYGHIRNRVTYCHHLPQRFQRRVPPGFTLFFGPGGFYFGDRSHQGNRGGGGEELVCLVSFFNRSQVNGGADGDVEQARILPRSVAEQLDGPNDRNRIFTYGSNQKTRQTCNYLDNLNNHNSGSSTGNDGNGNNNQDVVCLVTFFDKSQVNAGADANVERAQLLPRNVAEQRDGPDDRNRIFEYGNSQKTRDTCSYLDGLNN